jgi:hypothetical protein
MVLCNILVPTASVCIETARGAAGLMAAVLGSEWAWRMRKIMAWCTGWLWPVRAIGGGASGRLVGPSD